MPLTSLAADTVFDAAYAWLCRRRGDQIPRGVATLSRQVTKTHAG